MATFVPHAERCGQNYGTYCCARRKGHPGFHACHINGGALRWSGPYDGEGSRLIDLDQFGGRS